MKAVELIIKKKEGKTLTAEEIQFFFSGFTTGAIPDYQASAMLMAICFQGLNPEETLALTDTMLHSGDVIDLSIIPGVKVDKHSTGGVGDKTSIVLCPLVAAAGLPVAKLSGRGLGHTGGTIDKLEAIPGFSAELSEEKFIEIVRTSGVALAGQTKNLVPADKKIYALRDVTGTVQSMPLIASSIISKKLASGSDTIVLDVKTGSGAFMTRQEDAFELARHMIAIGKQMGKPVAAVVSNMEQPLGNLIGNALEVQEAIETLKGRGPNDLLELCLTLGSQMLVAGGKSTTSNEARALLLEKIASGEALTKFREWITSQGGDPNVVENYDVMPVAKYQQEVLSVKTGFIAGLKALPIGLAAMELGAGRANKTSKIDLSAGIQLHKKTGSPVKKGEPLCTLYSDKENVFDKAVAYVEEAYSYASENVIVPELILGTLT